MGYLREVEENINSLTEKLSKGARVLDVGCGTQIYKPLFKDFYYTGIDIDIVEEEGDSAKPDIYFDGENIPFPDDTFDLVICIEVLEHAENYERLVENMSRVLKKNGKMLITTPFMWAEHGLPYDFRRLTENGLKQATERYSLKTVSFEKARQGIDAIRTIINSEMTIFKRRHVNHRKPLKRLLKILDIPANILWGALQWYWSLFYRFERIYIRNVLIAEKI